MSIFTHTYSSLVTTGLGVSACCTGLTAQFGLDCGCSEGAIIIPPVIGGGGGPYPISGFYVPFPSKLKRVGRTVLISVRNVIDSDTIWRRIYNINGIDSTVTISNINVRKFQVQVDDLKRTDRYNVSATFTTENERI